MKPLIFSDAEKKKHKDARFLFFDFETYVGEKRELIPNLAVGTSK
jgi:hypothetical protein